MRVINTTNIAKGTGVKVIGIGEYRIMPGESAEIPDSIAYIMNGGKKVIAPAIVALSRTNQIRYEEAPTPAVQPQSPDGAPAGDGGTDQTDGDDEKSKEPEMTEDEKKKAEAAAKRKAAREAKKAAEASAKAAAENKAE